MKSVLLSLSALLAGIGLLTSCSEAGNAYWITAENNGNDPNTWICFQKDLNVGSVPKSMPVRIAADSKYWLYINGEPVITEGGVKRGPTPDDTYMDQVDLAPYLSKGENCISVLLWYFGKEGFSHKSSGEAALFVDSKLLKSDSTWVATVHPAFFTPEGEEPNFRLPESNIGFDARKDITDWTARYNAEWPAAKQIGTEGDAPWGKLYDRVIPQWRNQGLNDYVSVELRKGEVADTIYAKLPYNCHAMPYMSVTAPEGLSIDIRTDHYMGGSQPNVFAQYITRDGEQTYLNPGWMNGEYVIYTVPAGVTVNEVKYLETGYDTDFSGSFSSSDEFLNRIWDKARRTLYVTMRDTYMDCPDRERAQWWGDEVNESGEAFYALSPSSHLLMKKGMYELINWQCPDSSIFAPVPAGNWEKELPGQMLASVGRYGFWNYYLNTGDIEPIRDLYDGVSKYLAMWNREPDGTIQPRTGGWHWGDWGMNIDKRALYNAWYYIALDGQKNMAQALGRTAEADSIASEMSALKEAFNRVFWTGKAYRSPDYTEDTDDRVQALAVVAGLADKEKHDAIADVFATTFWASPYMEKYVGEALFMMGRGEDALARTRERFGPMVDDELHTTLWEGWGIGTDGYGGGTTNHAWSGGTLTLLSQYVCGVRPLEPGYEVAEIAPMPSGLEYATAVVPTVKGLLMAGFNDSESAFTLNIELPEGVKAVVRLPYGGEVKEISTHGIHEFTVKK
ncbi:MAG: glycoside hydrolase [Muribaculaceae bacterium]|nr:glycoside hydrolase [Muribaculaceae bacterium]